MEAATGPVNYRIGNEKLIRVLDAASAKLRALLARQGRAFGALRVSVNSWSTAIVYLPFAPLNERTGGRLQAFSNVDWSLAHVPICGRVPKRG